MEVGRAIAPIAEFVAEPHPRRNAAVAVYRVNEHGGQLPVLICADQNDRRRH